MTKEELKAKIENSSNSQLSTIADEIMGNPIPWFFINQFGSEAIRKYQEFRVYMASVFNVTTNDIMICGSSLLGYSLSPDKNYADFNGNSDVDIVIISKRLFNEYWKEFFNDYVYSKLTGNNYKITAKNIFKHFVDFHYDYVLTHPLYIKWEKKTSGYIKDLQIKFNFPEKISYRIYSSFEEYKQNLIKTLFDIKNPYIS